SRVGRRLRTTAHEMIPAERNSPRRGPGPDCGTLFDAPYFHLAVNLLRLLEGGETDPWQARRSRACRHAPAHGIVGLRLALQGPNISGCQGIARPDGTNGLDARRDYFHQATAGSPNRAAASGGENH